MKLTAKTIAAIALPEGKSDFITWDEDLPGFGYRVRLGAGGRLLKSFVCQYKRNGASRRMTFDASVLGAEQARAEARKVLAKVELGHDPQGEKTEQRDRDRLSMKSQVAAYLDSKRSKLAERSMIEATRYLTDPKYFGPLHGKSLDGIKRRDVADRVVTIGRECGAATAVRARGTLSAFFTWAMRMGLCESNPVMGAATPAVMMISAASSGCWFSPARDVPRSATWHGAKSTSTGARSRSRRHGPRTAARARCR